MKRLAFLLALLLGAPAAAADPIEIGVKGPGAKSVEAAIERALGDRSVEGPLVIEGRIKKEKKRRKKVFKISLTVKRGDGTVIGTVRVSAASRKAVVAKAEPKLKRVLDSGLSRKIAKVEAAPKKVAAAPKKVAAAPKKKAPVKPEPEDEDEDSDSSSSSTADSVSDADVSKAMEIERTGAKPWISIAVGPELVGRHFSYTDDIFQELRQYDLAGAAALGATAEAYPVADRPGPIANLGGAARLSHAPSFRSDSVTGEVFTSTSTSWALGARYRKDLLGLEVLGALDFGSQSFSVDSAMADVDSQVPDVRYKYLRPGLAARMGFRDRYAGEVAFGYRHVLSTGEISTAEYFPRLSARGFDIEGAVSARLFGGFDVRAGAALEQYGYALKPEPGDMRVAGGAVDRYPRFFLRLGYSR
jgi:hypothetical protein